MRRRIGRVTVTTIVEQDLHGLNALIAEARPERVREIAWLAPHHADDTGALRGSIQAFVIEAPDRLIVVDTCVGDGKARGGVKEWHRAQTGFLERFHTAGFDPDRVDTVLCTHLHLDHVGWNTRWTGSHWAPTFPRARYLFAEVELAHLQARQAGEAPGVQGVQHPLARALAQFDLDQREAYADSVRPILEAGLADIVACDHRVCAEVSLFATPGHTPGHVSVRIQSEGQEGVITGDCIHHPCQLARPNWSTLVDDDPAIGVQTRRRLLEELAASGAVLMGSHFAEPVAGRIAPDGDGFRLLPEAI